jgi:SAM-dependent methyltransferase
MKTIQCNLCSGNVSRKSFIYRSRDIDLIQCPGCGLVFDADLIINPDTASRIGVQDGIDFYFKRNNNLLFKRELHRLFAIVPPPAKLLDFGCGVGLFLKEASLFGYELCGVETNKSAIEYMLLHENIPVLETVEEVIQKYGEKSFDIIFLNHSLEHVSDPMHILTSLYKILKPSGLIGIVVPAYNRLTAFIDKFYRFLIEKGHLYYYTEKTLSEYLIMAGFKNPEKVPPLMGGFLIRSFSNSLSNPTLKILLEVVQKTLATAAFFGININLALYARK